MTTSGPNQPHPASSPPPLAPEREPGARDGVQRSVAAPLTAVLVGLAVALVAQFPLDSFAETSDAAHWFQHALLFWSGIVAGVGLYGLYRGAQERP